MTTTLVKQGQLNEWDEYVQSTPSLRNVSIQVFRVRSLVGLVNFIR